MHGLRPDQTRCLRVGAVALLFIVTNLWSFSRNDATVQFDPHVLRLLAQVTPSDGPAAVALPAGLPQCCLNFFGLPRSFRAMALPSVVKNILVPNAKYECDIVVHYYKVDRESSGRYNRGGIVDSDSVRLLEDVARVVARKAKAREPSVVFVQETMEDFLKKYGDLVQRYKTEINPRTKKPMYFPWSTKAYRKTDNIIRNVVMQWNSIQSGWEAMERLARRHESTYERIAYLRTDALYASPVDIYLRDNFTINYNNNYAVVPAFGMHPVSDRMIYGPYEAVKIWATERFRRLDQHVIRYETKGYGMHSERYMGHEILPSIVNKTGVEVVENSDICFYRTRAENSVMISDCSNGGAVRGIFDVDEVALVERMVDQTCQKYPFNKKIFELQCTENATSPM